MRRLPTLLCLLPALFAGLVIAAENVTQEAADATHWQVSPWNNPGTGNGAWCGAEFAPCLDGDPPEGYGHDWSERLDFYGIVPDPNALTIVRIEALLNHDLEPNYDFVYLQVERSDGMATIAAWTGNNRDVEGVFRPVVVNECVYMAVEDYVREGRIHLRWTMISDGSWDDEDCLLPTSGACTVDDIVVSFNDVVISSTDFDDAPATLGDWRALATNQDDDFASTWPALDSSEAVLAANSYPNPFNPRLTIAYVLPRPGALTVRIFNVRGELVRTVFSGSVTACAGTVEWDGTDNDGQDVESGVYFYQIRTADHETFEKVTMLK